MTQHELLQEFAQLPIRQQLEMLREALAIVEQNFEASQKPIIKEKTENEAVDPLLALAGQFITPLTDIAENHDYYIGEELMNDHA